MFLFFVFLCYGEHRVLPELTHSLPTRPASDLLDADYSDLRHRRGEGRAMAARRGDIDRVSKMIAVEIIGLARRDQRMREGGDDVVPAHVRDAQGRCGVERAHRAADPAESFVATKIGRAHV